VDQLANWRNYSNLPRIRQAFELLVSPESRTWPDGRVQLDGDRIIAMPQGYLTRPVSQCRWEAHRRYIDIQYIVSGEEKMGWAPVATLCPETTFDESADVGFFTGTGDFVTVREGIFALFFPHDAHMPCMQVGDTPAQVRKVVMKVAVD